jgi:alginate O-acetyltransferase complex protein AlgI
MRNFDKPYLSFNLTEFWRRWHISLSGWFRDYVYFPLGGNKKGNLNTAINLTLVFGLSGIWHGANWTFLIWGLWHGFGLLAERFLFKKWISSDHSTELALQLYRLPTLVWIFSGWFFFRVNSIYDIKMFAQLVFEKSAWTFHNFNAFHSNSELGVSVFGICLLMFFEAKGNELMKKVNVSKWYLETSLLGLLFFVILWFGHFKGQDFIYFQF